MINARHEPVTGKHENKQSIVMGVAYFYLFVDGSCDLRILL